MFISFVYGSAKCVDDVILSYYKKCQNAFFYGTGSEPSTHIAFPEFSPDTEN